MAIDLKEVILVDREVVGFLAFSEAGGTQLRNCPAYIREWLPERGLGLAKNSQTGTQEAKMVSKISSPDCDGVRPSSESSTMRSSAITNFHLSQDGKPEDDTHGMIGDSPALRSVLDQIG